MEHGDWVRAEAAMLAASRDLEAASSLLVAVARVIGTGGKDAAWWRTVVQATREVVGSANAELAELEKLLAPHEENQPPA